MDDIFSTHSISISDLRETPALVFEQAGNTAVAVLNHNRPVGYIVSPQFMANIMDQLADRAVANMAAARLPTLGAARPLARQEL